MAEKDGVVGLRVFIQGGGCAGFQYGFHFVTADEVEDDDFQLEEHGIKLVIDPLSAAYLEGASVEYSNEFGDQFLLKNPNFTGQCGCGSSFSV